MMTSTSSRSSVRTASTLQDGLPAPDTSWAAWRFLLASIVLDFVVWGGSFAAGSFQSYYETHEPFNSSSPTTLSAIGTTWLVVIHALILGGLLWIRRFPHLATWTVWGGLLLWCIAWVGASFANHVAVLIVCQGILVGVGGGAMYSSIFVFISQWFIARRGLAGGLVFAGAGIGGFAFPLILDRLFPAVGWRWTLRIFGLSTGALSAVALLFIRPRVPLPPQRSVLDKDDGAQDSMDEEKRRVVRLARRWRFLLDPVFLAFVPVIFVQGLHYGPYLLYLASYGLNFTTSFLASLSLALLNAMTIVGQICTGAACDIFPWTAVVALSSALSTVAVFALFAYVDDAARLIGFAVLMGFTAGGYSSVWYPASLDISGGDKARSSWFFGLLAITRGISTLVGPVITGEMITDDTVSTWGLYGYRAVTIFTGVMGAVALIGAGWTQLARVYRRKKEPLVAM